MISVTPLTPPGSMSSLGEGSIMEEAEEPNQTNDVVARLVVPMSFA